MKLPEYVLQLLQQLESAGFPCYAVGGCVRDHLLGRTPHDFDLCTAATPSEMKALFSGFRLILAGEKHGTVGVITPQGVVEITTFRTESDYTDNRHPAQVAFVRSIEEDLARRDFTVNAMAFSPIRGLCDPFGGADDLKSHVLRAVGDPFARFQEDSLRILRGVRFSARFRLTPEETTLRAMYKLAPLMDNLSRERVFDELCKLLPIASADDLLLYAPVLTAAIPELAPTLNFNQHNPHHIHDVYTHTAHVVAGCSDDLPLRWAALLHDVGKPVTFTLDDAGQGHFYGHAKVSAQMSDDILRRLKAPTALRETVVTLVAQHMTYPAPEEKPFRRLLSRFGPQMLQMLLKLQRADSGSKGTLSPEDTAYFENAEDILSALLAQNTCLRVTDLAINGHDLMALDIHGKAIGQALARLLDLVLDGQLENEKNALINAAKEL